MEMVLSAAIGVLAASGIWLLLRPRTFQVIVGLCLLSYAVNLFIFAMGRITLGAPPIMPRAGFIDPTAYTDPLPQALVLTAIVISFGMTAVLVIMALGAYLTAGHDRIDTDAEPEDRP